MNSLYEEIYKLKTIQRKGWLDRHVPDRVESDAEHTFSMVVLALEIMHKNNLGLDQLKVVKMITYHELDEIDVGDATPLDHISFEDRLKKQEETMHRLATKYDMPEIESLWKEFVSGDSKEAQFVREIDKYDAIKQSKIYADKFDMPQLYEEFSSFNKQINEKMKKLDR